MYKRKSLIEKTLEMSIASPQVIAYRLARFSNIGNSASIQNQKEFWRMITEKNNAFIESWNAMTMEAVRANYAFTASMFNPFFLMSKNKRSVNALTSQMQKLTYNILEKGLDPIHRKAIANSKRLAKYKNK